MIRTANLGFPRMGAARELKWALERAWAGDDHDAEDLSATAAALRDRHWRLQADRGLTYIPSGDFSLYDHVLDAVVAVGAIPERFGRADAAVAPGSPEALERYFTLARGGDDRPAMELTKWFDTNYHYLVPELAGDQRFVPNSAKAVGEWREAAALGIATRPVLLGPVSFLRLASHVDGGGTFDLLDPLLAAYEALVTELTDAGATALCFDEPILVEDLDDSARHALRRAYDSLRAAAPEAELMVASYFGPLGDNAELALGLPVDVVHVDLLRGPGQLDEILAALPGDKALSLGVVDGRNVWRSDLAAVQAIVEPAVAALGPDRVQLAPSCSLLHLPIDVEAEAGLDDELRGWLAFAIQRLDEVATLAAALDGDDDAIEAVAASARTVAAKAASGRVVLADVRRRVDRLSDNDATRTSPYRDRREVQRKALELPALATTTIGSFPQTPEVRRLRAQFRAGTVDSETYEAGIGDAIEDCILRQEGLGLDVLVHGEFERTDMVEYFGEQLEGLATTGNGWVQSYGSRCVKPPILFGDVARRGPMTVRWGAFAQALTPRPVKGMLTGPVTILQWSFVRDDQPAAHTARQVALALRDEVADLEKAGLQVIQIDEPALREGLPLRRADRPAYLAWATEAFRIAAGGAGDATQIHTHMCYAEFDDIIDAVAALDADVVSFEASRSAMTILGAFAQGPRPHEIGPGIWDIHSPRVPTAGELDRLLDAAVSALGCDGLWVNPDCGLKTRRWPEVEAALANMVAAARRARARCP